MAATYRQVALWQRAGLRSGAPPVLEAPRRVGCPGSVLTAPWRSFLFCLEELR